MSESVIVWGRGAIGGTIGAYLRRAGHEVLFVDVVPEHVEAIAAGRAGRGVARRATSARRRLDGDWLNAAIIRVCRALGLLDRTRGNRFAHDPALPLSAGPTLAPLKRLAAAKPGTDEARLLSVSAREARNRVAHALRQAQESLVTSQ